MKIRNSSRIIALALALVMIVPLISVPTFAADAVVGNDVEKYFEDFTDMTDAADMYADGANAAAIAKDAIIPDPTNSNKGKVWSVDVATHSTNNTTPTSDIQNWFNYAEHDSIVYQYDFYVEAGATGRLGVDVVLYADGSTLQSASWYGFYSLDLTNGKVIPAGPNRGDNTNTAVNDASFATGTWYTFAMVLDLKAGSYSLYLDGNKLMNAQLPVVNVKLGVSSAQMYINKAKSASDTGTVYFDNVTVYEGTKPTNAKSYLENFDSYEVGNSADFMYADGVTSTGKIAAAPAKSSVDKAWAITVADHAGKNHSVNSDILKWFNYKAYSDIVYQYDFYVPTGATGVIGMELVIKNTGAGYGWIGSCSLDLTNKKVIAKGPANPNRDSDGAVAEVNYTTFENDTWYTVAIAYDLVNGDYTLYLDGYKLMEIDTASTNWEINSGFVFLDKAAAGGTGTVCFDNVTVYEGTEPTNAKDGKRPATPYVQDFTNMSNAADMYVSGANAAAIAGDAIIPDPTNKGMGKVWKVDVATHSTNNTAANSAITGWFNYAAYDSIVYQYDFYVEAGATGQLGVDAVIYADGSNSSGAAWNGFYALDFTNGKIIPVGPGNGNATVTANVNDPSFATGTWYTFAMALNLDTGAYSLYLDGYKLMDAQLPVKNFKFSGAQMYINKADSASDKGTVYFDNVTVYEATEPTNVQAGTRPSDPYYEDFSANAPTGTNAIHTNYPADGENKVAQIKNHHDDSVTHANISKNYADVVLQADYYLDCKAGDSFNLVSQILYMDGKDANEASQKAGWTALFSIWHDQPTDVDHARLSMPNGVQQATYYRADNANKQVFVPTNEWFTVSVVINMKSGMYTIYVDGIAYAEASFASLTDLSWRTDSVWYVLKTANSTDKETTNPGEAYVDNLAIYDAADSLKEAEVDAGKDLQYIDVTIDGETTRTLVTKYLAKEFSAEVVYFNDGGKYDAIVSKPTDGTTSVRYGEPTGLRFKTTINEALVAELQAMVANGTLKAVEMGTLIAPADWAADTAALKALKAYTSDEYNALETKPAAGTYALKVAVGEYYEENTIVGSIVNIKEGNYDRDFAAAGYVKVTLLSGKTVVIVAADATVDSVKDVAQRVIDAAKDGDVTLSTYQKNVLLGFGAVEA